MNIAQVAKEFDLTPDTLRYYEKIGLIPPVPRTKGGIREYDRASCDWIEFIKCMRSAGLPIEVLIEYLNLFQEGDKTHEKRKQLLIEQRNNLRTHLEELVETINRLDKKIEMYDSHIIAAEEKLLHK